jgi:hypothetical protein
LKILFLAAIKRVFAVRNILFIFFFSATYAQAQELFTGIVVDSASFTPMPYVSVVIKDKGRGTLTDDKGHFTLMATRADTLVLSFIGYSTANYPLADYEPGLIRLGEKSTVLKNITVRSTAINPYEGMFDDQNAKLEDRRNPFYFSKKKKEKRKLGWLREDNLQASTYVEVMIRNTELKEWLKKRYALTDKQYYDVLARFNEKNAKVMYYITDGELITLVKNFFEVECIR